MFLYGVQFWNDAPGGQASMVDQTKSLRIQSLEGRGSGSPTGLVVNRVIPSVPSFLTDERAWQLIQEDCLRFMPTFSPSMIEFPSSVGLLFESTNLICTPSRR